jgi:hypothetical protein
MAETVDLKSLARRVIERDRGRDTRRDKPASDCLAAELASRRPLEAVSLSRSLNEQDHETAICPATGPIRRGLSSIKFKLSPRLALSLSPTGFFALITKFSCLDRRGQRRVEALLRAQVANFQ